MNGVNWPLVALAALILVLSAVGMLVLLLTAEYVSDLPDVMYLKGYGPRCAVCGRGFVEGRAARSLPDGGTVCAGHYGQWKKQQQKEKEQANGRYK